MKRIAVILGVIVSLVPFASAQINQRGTSRVARTITNNDLDRFRQKRLAAERHYRDNYDQMGFPSPAELDRQLEQERMDRFELSAKLREERLERERIAAERARAEAEIAAAYNAGQAEAAADGYQPFYGFGAYGGFGGYGSYYGGYPKGYQRFGRFFPRHRGFGFRFSTITGYRATPVGVVDVPIRVRTGTSRIVFRKR